MRRNRKDGESTKTGNTNRDKIIIGDAMAAAGEKDGEGSRKDREKKVVDELNVHLIRIVRIDAWDRRKINDHGEGGEARGRDPPEGRQEGWRGGKRE
jgi:hypothetical protein